MEVIFDEDARRDLKKMDHNERILIYQRVKKILEIGPRRHFEHGIDVYKENVGVDGRMPFLWDENESKLRIMRCFTDHKAYEKWYKSYKK